MITDVVTGAPFVPRLVRQDHPVQGDVWLMAVGLC